LHELRSPTSPVPVGRARKKGAAGAPACRCFPA
jgi:hypothetical protein